MIPALGGGTREKARTLTKVYFIVDVSFGVVVKATEHSATIKPSGY